MNAETRIAALSARLAQRNMPQWLGATTQRDVSLRDVLLRQYDEIAEEEQLRIMAAYDSDHPAHPFRFSSAARSDNDTRNRYRDILPYDYNRVVLKSGNNSPGTDYINASVVAGMPGSEQFIVAQGPLPSTQADFWQMAWENDINVVVMLTLEEEKGRVKCHPYWPVPGEQMVIPNIDNDTLVISAAKPPEVIQNGAVIRRLCAMQQITQPPEDAFVHRANRVIRNTDTDAAFLQNPVVRTKCVVQLHFLEWPDFHQCEASQLLALIDHVAELVDQAHIDGLLPLLDGTPFQATSADRAATAAALARDQRGTAAIANAEENASRILPNDALEAQASIAAALPLSRSSLSSSFISRINSEDVTAALDSVTHVYDASGKLNFTNARAIVHCSAGCGRSGTFCVVDTVIRLLRKLDNPGNLDLIQLAVRKMREQRVSMVQAFDQYVLIYEAVLLRLYQWQMKEAPNPPSWMQVA